MKPKVLLVYKRSTYDIYREKGDASLKELLEQGTRGTIEELIEGDIENRSSLKHVLGELSFLQVNDFIDFNPENDAVYRGELEDMQNFSDYDLVISLGGDGTVLEVSHYLMDTPLLGINSDPRHSEGNFCATDRHGFERIITRVIKDRMRCREYNRLEVELNGDVVDGPLLNEVFIAERGVGRTTRYDLEDNLHEDLGLLVSTAAGSTAWTKSAGGEVLPSSSRDIQLISRRLGNGYHSDMPYFVSQDSYIGLKHGDSNLASGIVEEGELVKLTSMTRAGRVFVGDKDYKFTIGDELEIKYVNQNAELKLNGELLECADYFLVAHEDPSAMTRYEIEAKGKKAKHTNSGFLFVPSPELFRDEGFQYNEIVDGSMEIVVTSQMDDGMICLDGSHIKYDFKTGDIAKIRNSEHPLRLYI